MTGSLENAVERLAVGDAQPPVVDAGNVLLLEDRLDLWTRSVHNNEADAEAVQKIQVVNDAQECVVCDHFAAEGDDEGLAAKRMNIRCSGTYPLHERPR